jgi:DNA modification methylase
MVKVIAQEAGADWSVYHSDCVQMLAGIPSDSIHFSMFSPPFKSLYVFSDDPRDVSNCRDDKTFWDQYRFVINELYRVIRPGRLISIHCMDLPTSITRDGFVAMQEFPDENLRLCKEAGFRFHSRTFIRKDPVVAMQRSKAIGLLHKQVVKDSAMSRMAIGDQLITVRKPGTNDEPISGIFETYYGDDITDAELTREAAATWREATEDARTFEDHKSIAIWQRYAEPCWMDIVQSDTLSRHMARDEHDERHISPLQKTPVRRCIDMWTNPGDVVLSPFTGIGTVGYIALELGRRFVGAELKASYYRQAVANLREAERIKNDGTLFDTARWATQ